MLKPQAFGHFSLQETGSCALVAAAEAMGVNYADFKWSALVRRLSITTCPECGERENPSVRIITVHLNDTHKWTRERIADFVETIENQQDRLQAAEAAGCEKVAEERT